MAWMAVHYLAKVHRISGWKVAGVLNGSWVLQYAKAMEDYGRFGVAAAEYERGGDVEAAVRLHLSNLNNANKAFALARCSGSVAAAAKIARHCAAASQWAGAVEFSVRAQDFNGAWQIAQTHQEMDAYAAALDSDAPPDMHAQVAVYFQNVKEHAKAAAQYEAAGNMLSAVSQLMAHSKRVRAGPNPVVVVQTPLHGLQVSTTQSYSRNSA